MKLRADHIKLALLSYYRFRRQCVCVDEFNGADVIVDTGKQIYEIEVKISRSDLTLGESKKRGKHECYRVGRAFRRCHPNRFFFCVPSTLENAARSKIQALNPRYGLILFDDWRFSRDGRYQLWENLICTIKQAQVLHAYYHTKQRELIARRASSKLITLMQKEYSRESEIARENPRM